MKYGYIRVSSVGQSKYGYGLETQKEAILKCGVAEENIFADVKTGTTMERKELQRLLSRVQDGDQVVVYKIDRLGRTLNVVNEVIDEFDRKGCSVSILDQMTIDTKSINGRLLKNLLSMLAEFDHDLIVERMREGKETARKRPGYREGRRPVDADKLDAAMSVWESSGSIKKAVKVSGISERRLYYEKKKRRQEAEELERQESKE